MAFAIKQHIGSQGWVDTISTYGSIVPSTSFSASIVAVPRQVGIGCKCVKAKFSLSVACGAGKSRTFTLYQNGSPTACTVTISGATDKEATWEGSLAITQGDTLYLVHAGSGTPASSNLRWYITFISNTATQWFAAGGNNMGGTNRSPLWTDGISSSDEQTVLLFPTKLIYFGLKVVTTPAAGTEYIAYIKKNDVEVAGSRVTIVNGQTEGHVYPDASFSAGDRIQIYTDKTGSPSIQNGSFSLGFENTGSDPYSYMICNGQRHFNGDTANAVYGGFNSNSSNTNEALIDAFFPEGMKVRGMYLQIRGPTGGTDKRYTCVLRNNKTTSHFSCFVGANGSGSTPNYFKYDINHADDFTVPVEWGNVCVQCTPSGTPYSKDPVVGFWAEDYLWIGGRSTIHVSRSYWPHVAIT
jgi:hypothetical protein